MKLNKVLIFLALSLLAACKKDAVPHVYQSQVIYNGVLPLMGGVIDWSGNLKSFSLPAMERPLGKILESAKIYTFESSGGNNVFYDFFDNKFSTGSWGSFRSGNIDGVTPINVRADLAYLEYKKLFMSFNRSDKISIVSENGIHEIQAKQGITSIISNFKKGAFFITAPAYDPENGQQLISPATIYEIDSLENISSFFTFPQNVSYTGFNFIKMQNLYYHLDILINISNDKKGNLYVCFGYDNIIYKIDREKNLSIYRNDIFCPSSLVFNNNDEPFVVSAPKFIKTTEGFKMEKPVEVFALSDGNKKKIYQGQFENYGNIFRITKDWKSIFVADACYNISSNLQKELFLEDPVKRQIVLIK